MSFRKKIDEAPTAITFNDLVLLPGFIEVEPSEIDIGSRFSKNIPLNIPFVSAPMDSVTEHEMAIALALQGGIGVLHRNCSREEQVEMAKKVKNASSFIIRDVKTISPNDNIKKARELMEIYNIHALPVVDEEKRLLGLVTWRDIRFVDNDLTVKDVMTHREKLVTAGENIEIGEAVRLLQKYKIEKLPIVNREGKLIGLITIKDIEMNRKYPKANRDEEGRLRVAAAISPYDMKRAMLLEKFVDTLVIDVAHFHNKNVLEATRKILEAVDVDIIAGNLATYKAAIDTLDYVGEVHGLRVGLGSGSICTTPVVTRVFAPTLYAVANVADAVKEMKIDIPIIADGGIRTPGDVALALALGASSVMMGNVFAGCKEAPGKLVSIGGSFYKEYWGMGSERSKSKRMALDRYSRPSKDITEGTSGLVPYRGTVEDVVKRFVAGLKASMGYAGAKKIEELWTNARIAKLTLQGTFEAKPHNLINNRDRNVF